MMERLTVQTDDQGLHEITDRIDRLARKSEVDEGMCTVFIQHTSASLVIQENAARAARRDLENWMNRLVEEDDPLYTHTAEGPDDMPAHIKSALTNTSLDIPVLDSSLALGTWQGIFVWEHRYGGRARNLVVQIKADR
jgi:secondary thiamine-phosphate synthase enzyme